ncbi:cysteine proteinase [Trametes coccinea BRFM310]|uniref:Cysteine proteinase n=1 Tax=Trametes coccinea (strain BRFM310) TaxID=1353009 RepID=A0A1Y2IPX9_TRAC3|nr:cysteine proteinase [Trametes coccinea BRFM310]
MAKHKKQTPQEIYWERKKREEEEKDASLPPGLINHGNTCFMNSTLQGLIATQPLRDLVFFQPVAPALQPTDGSPILAKRSPQLTNGHGLGGSDELEWTEGMPLGDIFTTIMRKAWGIQDAKRRESMSPKEILTTIGRKYDQYLDFRQQDAHEFLRHMLDAMRMEELDIIKKRQPPPPKSKRRRHNVDHKSPLPSPALPLPDSASQTSQPGSLATSHSEHEPLAQEPQPQQSNAREEEEKLQSFVDMLFGGQLASILVCEKCKKVSVTYEDFNDLSLSIKPEDYVKNRKRDRFRRIARKLRIRPPAPHEQLSHQDQGQTSGQEIDQSTPRHRGRGMFSAMQRASSVPASPVRRSSEIAAQAQEVPTHEDPRRKSFDHAGGEGDEARDVVKEMAGTSVQSSSLGSAIDEQDEEGDGEEITHAEAAEAAEQLKGDAVVVDDGPAPDAVAEDKAKEKEKKEKDDAWGKIARRISVSMKLGGGRDKEKDKDREQRDSRPSSRQGERGRRTDIKDAFRAMRGGEPRSPRAGSLAPGASAHETGSEAGDVSDAQRQRPPSPGPTSPLISSPLAQGSRQSSSRRSSTNPFTHHHHQRRKDDPPSSFSAPKMSEEEMAYLRQVLADVHPVTGNPLSILQNAFTSGGSSSSVSSGSTALATQALWAKLGHLPGIEECLRMFTAVEILDGENMVGCHRCWKIANGLYKPRNGSGVIPGERDTESSSEHNSETSTSASDGSDKSDASAVKSSSVSGAHPVVPDLNDMDDGAQQSSPDLSSGRVSPASTSFVSTQMENHSSSAVDDTTSISSAPTTVATSVSPPTAVPHYRKDSVLASGTYGGLPIPKISTTEVDTPNSAPADRTLNEEDRVASDSGLARTWAPNAVGVSPSDDSLLTPRGRRPGRSKDGKKESGTYSGDSSDDELDDSDSDASARSDGSASPSVSPSATPNSSVEKLTNASRSPGTSPRPRDRVPSGGGQAGAATKIPRSKQVIMRKMYKRYLISTPPPILVIHLKRFQQMAKVHTISLSGGFKKLDDFVAFPEYLDLAPFLAPKREDFTHEKDERHKGKRKREKCMYRLYAVVVHIGNMLGGHYVAYTALPQSSSQPAQQSSSPPPPTPSITESEKSTTPSLTSQESRSSQSSDQRQPRKWAYISDTVVRLATLEEVLKAKAYICMYERI